MRRHIRFTSLLTCVLFSLTLISCTAKPAESSDITNVFEAATETSGTSYESTVSETTSPSETTAVTTETTSETTSETTTEATTTATSETTATTSETTNEPSVSSSAQITGDASAIYRKIPEEKKNYIVYNEAFGGTITANAMNKGFIGITIDSDGNNLYGNIPPEALQFTVFYDERQNFTLRDAQGRFLSATSQGELILTDKPVEDNYQFWRMEEAEGGWHIINVGAAGNQALQYSSGTFSIKKCAKTSDFVFNFYEVG